jgi:DNA mismatch repair protein MutS2
MIPEKTLHTLEFAKVLERLAAHTSFSVSREMALALHPLTDIGDVEALQEQVRETLSLQDTRTEVSLGGARDIRPAVTRASLGGILDPGQLLEIHGTLEAAERVRGALSRLEMEEFPWLVEQRSLIGNFREIIALIAQTVSPQAEILDSASPALARIRADLRIAHQRLMDRLQSILSSPTYRPAIQEPIITLRNGRYVIPVRADSRGVLRGAVHDHSASGATLYVEPFQTNEMNNRWRELQLQEQEEIRRILQYLADRIGAQAAAILRAVDVLGAVDLALAKARYGASLHGVLPTLSDQGDLHFVSARHPLLTGRVVPISVRLGGDFRILLVTGPNTGGKTVALKTVGLLTLMAASGMLIPASPGSQAAIYDGIFADIGDEQSIEQNLSTFSSHLTNIINILKDMTSNSLLLLDELGAGTDPAEGSALARSLLTYLLARQVRVMATTHYSELKAFAASTEGVENANVEFDVETLTPTYRLSIGLPGRSNALAIAARLGLDPEIVRGSQEFITAEERRVERMLEQIAHDRDAAAQLFSEAQVAHEQAVTLRRRLEQEIDSVERERVDILQAARAEAAASLEDLRRELDRAETELRLSGARGDAALSSLRQRVEAAVQEQPVLLAPVRHPSRPALTQAPVPETGEIGVGDRVALLKTGQEGTVVAAQPGRPEVEVQIGPFKTRAKRSDLRPVTADAADVGLPVATPATRVTLAERPAPSMEFDMRGWRVDDVVPELERYLNDAYMANLPYVRLIHGKGTGALRQVVREELATNPLVSNFRSADAREGGEGVTIAELAG